MDLIKLKNSALFAGKVLGIICGFILLLGVALANAVQYSPIGTVIGVLVLMFAAMTLIQYRQSK